MLLSDYLTQLRLLVHDPNAADFTDTTLTGFINQARDRVALDTQCVRSYLPNLNTIAQQEIYPLTGFVGGLNVLSGGTNYTNPTITIAAPGAPGIQATALPVLQNGVIIDALVTNWGTLYTSVPTVTVTDATGTGANLTAIAGLNIVNWLQPIDILWGNLRINFEYLPFLEFNTYPRAYNQQFGRPGVFTVHLGNQQVYLYPIPDQSTYPMAISVTIQPNPLALPTDSDIQLIYPWNDAVQLYAAHLCYASIQNLGMADYYYSGGDPRKPLGKYELRVRQLPSAVTPYRITNPYVLSRMRLRRM